MRCMTSVQMSGKPSANVWGWADRRQGVVALFQLITLRLEPKHLGVESPLG